MEARSFLYSFPLWFITGYWEYTMPLFLICLIYNNLHLLTPYRRRQWQPTPVLLPGESQGPTPVLLPGESGSPWGHEESDTTERLHFHFSLACIGEGNGNPLQCSCLENPRDGGAWWAAIYGVAQSQTRLKWLSSSNPILPLHPAPPPSPWQ